MSSSNMVRFLLHGLFYMTANRLYPHNSRTMEGKKNDELASDQQTDVSAQATSPPGKSMGATYRAGQTAALAHIAQLIQATPHANDTIEKAVLEVGNLFQAVMGGLFLYEQERELKYQAGFGFSPGFIRDIEEVNKTDLAIRYVSGITSPLVAPDARSDPSTLAIGKAATSDGIVTLAWSPLISGGETLGLLLLCHKAERPYSSDDLGLLQMLVALLALTAANTRLAASPRSADGTKDRLFNVLSHELRTPLTSIMGFTQIVRKRLGNAQAPDTRVLSQLDVIWAQAQRLNRIIDTFVDIANIERGDFTISHGRVELGSVLRSAVRQANAQATTQPQINADIPDNLVWVHGDAKRLEQAFGHILANAIRYSPRDRAAELACAMPGPEREVTVTITDWGPGIPANRRKEVFDRFSSEEASAGGLGVGLYISKTIIEAHGGRISLQSDVGKGTTMSVVLPV